MGSPYLPSSATPSMNYKRCVPWCALLSHQSKNIKEASCLTTPVVNTEVRGMMGGDVCKRWIGMVLFLWFFAWDWLKWWVNVIFLVSYNKRLSYWWLATVTKNYCNLCDCYWRRYLMCRWLSFSPHNCRQVVFLLGTLDKQMPNTIKLSYWFVRACLLFLARSMLGLELVSEFQVPVRTTRILLLVSRVGLYHT